MLNNLVIIELANVLAGPAVGMFFAELGATVIKIENPRSKGDVTRSWKLSSEAGDSDISSYFSSVNWGKKSIAVDVTRRSGQKVIYDLVHKADVVISSYKPGDDQKLGMDYNTLSSIKADLIYGQITGYGANDPRAGYDAILQAASGFTYMNGNPDGTPTKMPVALIDLLAAHQLKEALLLAILRRMQTGEGSYIHTSLLKSGIASLANQAANWLVAGKIPQRIGSEHPNIVPYGSAFKTKDNKDIVLAVGNDQQFKALCDVIERPELGIIPLYATNQQRVKNREKLNRLLAEQIGKYNLDPLLTQLNDCKVPTGGILNMEEVLAQDAGQELMISDLTANGSRITGLRTIAFESNAVNFNQKISPPPHLSEHAGQILAEFLKYDPSRILRLKKDNAVLLKDKGERMKQ